MYHRFIMAFFLSASLSQAMELDPSVTSGTPSTQPDVRIEILSDTSTHNPTQPPERRSRSPSRRPRPSTQNPTLDTLTPVLPTTSDSPVSILPTTVGSTVLAPTTTQVDTPVTDPVPHDFNPNEDVPGCVDNYFRCQVGFWRISEGWFDFAITLSQAGALYFGGSVVAGSPVATNGVGLMVCQSVAFFGHVLKNHALKAINDNRVKLRQVISEAHGNNDHP